MEWMRFAKSRSTRSKLRAYFRSKQHDSVRKSGELIFFDYLNQHCNVIQESSYLGHEFQIPQNAEELSQFLPGRSHYNDVGELLHAIGKSGNRNFLRTKISKIFLVPLSVLETSDEGRYSKITQEIYADQVDNINGASLVEKQDGTEFFGDVVDLPEGDAVEYADAECACRHCLPVRGDTIIGTKGHVADAPTIVHRLQCPYAQQAINDDKSGAVGDEVVGDPVNLVWSDEEAWEEGNSQAFLTEIVIMANDRKLLLADCSVVASKNSEILNTASSSSTEHCTLEFLVKVSDLDELQALMDKLRDVHSVMAVERRVSTYVCILHHLSQAFSLTPMLNMIFLFSLAASCRGKFRGKGELLD